MSQINGRGIERNACGRSAVLMGSDSPAVPGSHCFRAIGSGKWLLRSGTCLQVQKANSPVEMI